MNQVLVTPPGLIAGSSPTLRSSKAHVDGLQRYSAGSRALLAATDLFAFLASFYIAMGLVQHTWHFRAFELLIAGSAWLSIVLSFAMFAKLGMYRKSVGISQRDEFYSTVAALAIGITPQLLIFTLVPSLNTSRLVVLVAAGCAVLAVGGLRTFIRPFIRSIEAGYIAQTRVLAVSASEPATPASATYRCDFTLAKGESSSAILERMAWFRAAAREGCDLLVIESLLPSGDAAHVVALAERFDVQVIFAPPELQENPYDLIVERRGGQTWLAPVQLSVLEPSSEFCKALFDRACAALAIALLLPLFIVMAVAIRLEDRGPVFFRQERVGRNGKTFKIFKFRSMHTGASSEWATANDMRITRVGAILRRFSLDELPQLFNVLVGDMSLVGPRPEMREYAERFSARLPRYAERHLVRPGITGWSQINLRRELTPDDVEEVLHNDLFYIENWSFQLDLSILLKTATEFLFHRGV